MNRPNVMITRPETLLIQCTIVLENFVRREYVNEPSKSHQNMEPKNTLDTKVRAVAYRPNFAMIPKPEKIPAKNKIVTGFVTVRKNEET